MKAVCFLLELHAHYLYIPRPYNTYAIEKIANRTINKASYKREMDDTFRSDLPLTHVRMHRTRIHTRSYNKQSSATNVTIYRFSFVLCTRTQTKYARAYTPIVLFACAIYLNYAWIVHYLLQLTSYCSSTILYGSNCTWQSNHNVFCSCFASHGTTNTSWWLCCSVVGWEEGSIYSIEYWSLLPIKT